LTDEVKEEAETEGARPAKGDTVAPTKPAVCDDIADEQLLTTVVTKNFFNSMRIDKSVNQWWRPFTRGM
jgi:hypothetical protein